MGAWARARGGPQLSDAEFRKIWDITTSTQDYRVGEEDSLNAFVESRRSEETIRKAYHVFRFFQGRVVNKIVDSKEEGASVSDQRSGIWNVASINRITGYRPSLKYLWRLLHLHIQWNDGQTRKNCRELRNVKDPGTVRLDMEKLPPIFYKSSDLNSHHEELRNILRSHLEKIPSESPSIVDWLYSTAFHGFKSSVVRYAVLPKSSRDKFGEIINYHLSDSLKSRKDETTRHLSPLALHLKDDLLAELASRFTKTITALELSTTQLLGTLRMLLFQIVEDMVELGTFEPLGVNLHRFSDVAGNLHERSELVKREGLERFLAFATACELAIKALAGFPRDIEWAVAADRMQSDLALRYLPEASSAWFGNDAPDDLMAALPTVVERIAGETWNGNLQLNRIGNVKEYMNSCLDYLLQVGEISGELGARCEELIVHPRLPGSCSLCNDL